MNVHERIQKINELKLKYPEFSKAYAMHMMCKTARLCADITTDPSMNIELGSLVGQLETELDDYYEMWTMTYYLVRRNDKTGLFEISKDGSAGKAKEYYSETEAIEQYGMDVEWRGKDNIMLLQTVSLNVSVLVTKREG